MWNGKDPPPPLCENFTNFPHDGEIKNIFTNLYSICFRPGTKFFIKNVAWKWRSDSRADLSETWSIRTTWNTFQWFISRGQMCRTISSGTSHICITTIKYLHPPLFPPLSIKPSFCLVMLSFLAVLFTTESVRAYWEKRPKENCQQNTRRMLSSLHCLQERKCWNCWVLGECMRSRLGTERIVRGSRWQVDS